MQNPGRPGRIEVEWKLALEDRRAYERLRTRLAPALASRVQENLYFDTSNRRLLLEHRGTLRLRKESTGRILLTFKRDATLAASGRLRAVEEEEELDETAWRAVTEAGIEKLRSPLLDEVRARIPGPLTLLGATTTLRETFRGPLDVACLLDATSFPDGTIDYELEVEAPPRLLDRASAELRRWLEQERIPWRPQAKTKLQRLLEHL